MKSTITINGVIVDKINGEVNYHNLKEHDEIIQEPIKSIKKLLDTHKDFSRATPEINYELIVAINHILDSAEEIEY